MEVREGDLLWTPGPKWLAETPLTDFLKWLEARGRPFADYAALWRWSIDDLAGFWGAIWDYFGVEASRPYDRVLGRSEMPGAEWFPGARLNYAQHALRHARPGAEALVHLSEDAPPHTMSWDDLSSQVRIVATHLRELGVRPGDRVAAYLPNTPRALIAMLATTSIGAIWASCSPDFGWRGVLDRFTQLAPKVLFCVDGYRYRGKYYDRRDELETIIGALGDLSHVVHAGPGEPPVETAMSWDELLDHDPVPAAAFEFEQVPFDHPLWILFSSGTTGLPKAIVHGHGGILLEQLKLQAFHMDFRPGDRVFFFTTTGWMMWNFLVSSLLTGAVPVLYDGDPTHPETDRLWRMASELRLSFFGSSPTYIDLMVRSGIVPRESHDFPELRTITLAGSPVTAECSAWPYRNVKDDLWTASGSGGTDTCCGLVGGVPTQPVYAGEIQGPSLGVAAHAFDEHGKPVVDEVGELVLTRPMPSMPVRFWNDEDGERYRQAYFADYPGVWRHGDFFRINERGGCFVLGRSDATLNRHGVRIGTAEIYRTLARFDEIEDALVVNLDLPGGKFFMPLFVALAAGRELDADLEQRIRARLRRDYTPRHVPDKIIQVPGVPVTLTGKKLEVPVRRILSGTPPELAANPNAMANPRTLDFFVEYARGQRDFPPPAPV